MKTFKVELVVEELQDEPYGFKEVIEGFLNELEDEQDMGAFKIIRQEVKEL